MKIIFIKKGLIMCVLIIVFSFSTYKLAYPKDNLKSNVKSIKVVMDDNYPPFVFRDNSGKPQGILIDQWRLFEKKTGIKVEINAMNWNKALISMQEGKFDVIDTIFYNNERSKIYDFTKAYVKIDIPIFFNKNIAGITGVDSLKGFSVAAKRGDNCVEVLKSHGINQILLFDSYEDIIKAAKEKKIVIFVMDKPPALYFMYKMQIQDNFNYADSLYASEFHRAVKKGNENLLNIVENGFSKISRDEYTAIDKKWYGTTNLNPIVFKDIIFGTLITLTILLILLLWNYTLQRKVKQKTIAFSELIEELKLSEARGRAILEIIPDMFFLLSKEGKFLDYHGVENKATYVPPEEFLGKNLKDIFPLDLAMKFLECFEILYETGSVQTIEYTLDSPNGPIFYESRLVICGTNQVVGIVRDITERKQTEEKLRDISIHDVLTGLYNRNYFENIMLQLQTEGSSSIGIIICDLDGLKLINDTLGHQMGDDYLITTGKLLRSIFPEESIISRIGGDEFTVLMLGVDEKQIENACNLFKESYLYNITGQSIPLSVSIGYIFSNGENINLYELLKEADKRMYREKLHRKQSMKNEIVQTLKKMLEARDFITEGHANRMEELAGKLAFAIGIPEKDVADIRLLAQFHDIGKVGIPDSILFKPEKLSEEEFEVMKHHPEIGHRIAQVSIDLIPISDGILKHHEHWDGSGYPFGVVGEDIPIQCRIISIIDAYDAMTNDRPYRKALEKEVALNELKRCAGTQFDPIMVDKFIELINEKY